VGDLGSSIMNHQTFLFILFIAIYALVSLPSKSTTEMTSKAIVVLCTTGSNEAGKALARKLVESKLAACVNIVPGATSIYSWQGKITEDEETLLIIKSQAQHVESISDFINKNHDYDVPEVIALPVTGGSEKYLDWVHSSTKQS